MPGEDGYDFIKRVRALNAKAAVHARGSADGAGHEGGPAPRA